MDETDESAEPGGSLVVATAAMTEFNDRTAPLMAIDRPGWRYVPDAYRVLGRFTALSAELPQGLRNVMDALRHELDVHLITIDRGDRYENKPDGAVAAACEALSRAVDAAQVLTQAVSDARTAIRGAAYGGRQEDLHIGEHEVSVWTSPLPAGTRRPGGLIGTTYSARCTCGWPQLPAMISRQTHQEADGEAAQHAQQTGHRYVPTEPW